MSDVNAGQTPTPTQVCHTGGEDGFWVVVGTLDDVLDMSDDNLDRSARVEARIAQTQPWLADKVIFDSTRALFCAYASDRPSALALASVANNIAHPRAQCGPPRSVGPSKDA